MGYKSDRGVPQKGQFDTSGELNIVVSGTNVAEKKNFQQFSRNSHLPQLQLLRKWLGTGHLSNIGGKSLDNLLSDMQSDEWTTRVEAIRAFEVLGKEAPIRIVQTLIGALFDPSAFVRATAARTLGMMEAKTAKTELLLAIGDKDWKVRSAALQALGRLGTEAPRETLINALTDVNSVVRTSAVGAVGELAEPIPLEHLLGMLKNDEDWLVRLSVLKVLRKRSVSIPIEILIQILQDENEDIRIEALKTLGKRGEPVPIEILIQVLQDENEDVRIEALKIFEAEEMHIPLEQVILSLKDPSKEVRLVASKLLGKFTPQIVQQVSLGFLLQCLYDEDEDVRAVAAWALGERGDQAAIIPLCLALSDQDALVQSAAEWAVKQLEVPFPNGEHLPKENAYVRDAINLAGTYRETYVQSLRLLSSLIRYLEDKRGFIQRIDMHDEQVHVLLCFYEGGERNSLQSTVLNTLESTLRSTPFVEYLGKALTGSDETLRAIANQVTDMTHDRSWAELLLVSLDLAQDNNMHALYKDRDLPTKIVIGGINYEHVRSTDGPILEQILSTYQKDLIQASGHEKDSNYQKPINSSIDEEKSLRQEKQTVREEQRSYKPRERITEPLLNVISDPCQLGGVPSRIQLWYEVPS
jgi:HEAT repeat protein